MCQNATPGIPKVKDCEGTCKITQKVHKHQHCQKDDRNSKSTKQDHTEIAKV